MTAAEAVALLTERDTADSASDLAGRVAIRALIAAVDAVLALHGCQPDPHEIHRAWCAECGDEWPCPTARALGVTE